mmetsp:Transcript_54997/g.128620  ORF Transcript_54997/g.128620 Transcript_54997/m.128620 type:complete len:662 (-) Transcript_54997:63-2048(-)
MGAQCQPQQPRCCCVDGDKEGTTETVRAHKAISCTPAHLQPASVECPSVASTAASKDVTVLPSKTRSYPMPYLSEKVQSEAASMSLGSLSIPSSFNRQVSMPRYYPTVCLPMPKFFEMTVMMPHEDLLPKLECPGEEVLIHFISHEWLGFTHPDPYSIQLSRMQGIFRTILEGEARSLFHPEEWTAFMKGVSVATAAFMQQAEAEMIARRALTEEELPEHISKSTIWMDYHSIPQSGYDPEAFAAAVNSIPHYVQRSNYFWICAPQGKHVELAEVRDYASWRGRGWCRLEEMANLLSSKLKMPLIITDANKLGTYGFFDKMMSLWGRSELSVANGRFTCCSLNHVHTANGKRKTIPCDRLALEPVLLKMWGDYYNKLDAEETHSLHKSLLRSIAPTVFNGFALAEAALLPEDESLEDFLCRQGYDDLDCLDGMGYPPLVWAAIYANMRVVKEIAEARPQMPLFIHPKSGVTMLMRAVHRPPSEFREILDLHEDLKTPQHLNHATKQGLTAVDRAAKAGFHENLRYLLELRANTETRRVDGGATPLMSAAQEGLPTSCQVLLEFRACIHAKDLHGKTALHHAADPVLMLGNLDRDGKCDVLDVLLNARADVEAVDDEQMTPFEIAMQSHNPSANKMSLLSPPESPMCLPMAKVASRLSHKCR